MKDMRKKILSQLADWTLFKWRFSPSINIHRENIKALFFIDKSHLLNSLMVVHSLEVNKDPFHPKGGNKKWLVLEVPYLNAIGALMYFTNYTRPNIAFSINLLARYNSTPTKRHWNGVKHILRYLYGTSDMGLYYLKESKLQLIGYANARYLLDPHKAQS